jgi:phosphosulfolactate synthase (CoM biosynthesis protein A)
MRYGYSVLPAVEREERIKRIVDACRQVAEASGSEIARLIGLRDGVSRTEEATLEAINNKLRIGR